MQNGGNMLKLNEFCHNKNPSGGENDGKKISDVEFRINMNNGQEDDVHRR